MLKPLEDGLLPLFATGTMSIAPGTTAAAAGSPDDDDPALQALLFGLLLVCCPPAPPSKESDFARRRRKGVFHSSPSLLLVLPPISDLGCCAAVTTVVDELFSVPPALLLRTVGPFRFGVEEQPPLVPLPPRLPTRDVTSAGLEPGVVCLCWFEPTGLLFLLLLLLLLLGLNRCCLEIVLPDGLIPLLATVVVLRVLLSILLLLFLPLSVDLVVPIPRQYWSNDWLWGNQSPSTLCGTGGQQSTGWQNK